jgi:hypothetical protein
MITSEIISGNEICDRIGTFQIEDHSLAGAALKKKRKEKKKKRKG